MDREPFVKFDGYGISLSWAVVIVIIIVIAGIIYFTTTKTKKIESREEILVSPESRKKAIFEENFEHGSGSEESTNAS